MTNKATNELTLEVKGKKSIGLFYCPPKEKVYKMAEHAFSDNHKKKT